MHEPGKGTRKERCVRIGFGLPQSGPAAGPDSLIQVSQRAEALGFDSVWAFERIIYPLNPQDPYPGKPDGSYPEHFKRVLDPMGVLTFVAGHTSRVGLGTSVLDMPYYNPVLLARQIATLDILSGGRAKVGLGLGWMKEEFDIIGRPMTGRGKLADEFISVMKAVWTMEPVEFQGELYQVPPSIIEAKPVQKPHPPIYLAAFTPAGLKRAATVADGLNPVFFSIDHARATIAELRRLTIEAGRDPNDVEVVVKADYLLTDAPLGGARIMFAGSADEMKADIEGCRDLGVAEIIFDPGASPHALSLESALAGIEQVRGIVG
jgi:probable F420-dependent oxidoreductase